MENTNPNVLMVAAECRDLAKVGGLADVVRDLSKVLKDLGIPVSVVLPYYDVTQQAAVRVPENPVDSFLVPFGPKNDWPVQVFRVELDGVPVYLLRSAEFFGGDNGKIYIDSQTFGRGPFEDDAARFAFFSVAVLEWLLRSADLSEINALHCHDWHTGVLLTLLSYDFRYRELARRVNTLFTIHNLDYQGQRPFELNQPGNFMSFSHWFPELYLALRFSGSLDAIRDRHADVPCFNPMRAGINLADVVNTVSPNYALEITQPDDPARNFIGGRGLEKDLVKRTSRLFGILNGLDYASNDPSALVPPFDASLPGWQKARRQHKLTFLRSLPAALENLALGQGDRFKNRPAVLNKMAAFQARAWEDKPLVVAVTRAVSQKVAILLEPLDGFDTVLRELLKRDIFLFVLGTGDFEDRLEEINQYDNGLFVSAFAAGFSSRLYQSGDLFLMPSDFEPCGISQMIAMRYGCLPLVPDVGGLKDTVQDRVTGFMYHGEDRPCARQALLDTLDSAIDCYTYDPRRWQAMQNQAMSARFEWSTSARKYIDLYRMQQSVR